MQSGGGRQRPLELTRGAIAPRRIRLDRPFDHLHDRLREVGAEIAQLLAGTHRVGPLDIRHRGTVNRHASSEQEEQQDAEAVHVGGDRCAGAVEKLGRHVERCAGEDLRRPTRQERLGAAEIHQDDAPADFSHHVLRLDVAVQEPGTVQRGQGPAEIDADAGHFPRAHRSGVAHHLGERLPFDVLHPDPDLAVVLVGAVGRDDVGVTDASEVTSFGEGGPGG